MKSAQKKLEHDLNFRHGGSLLPLSSPFPLRLDSRLMQTFLVKDSGTFGGKRFLSFLLKARLQV